MIRSGAAAILLIILLSSFLALPLATVHGSSPISAETLFSANVNQEYIEGQSFPIGILATYFQEVDGNLQPQTTTVEIFVTIVDLNTGQDSYNSSYNVSSGLPQYIYIPSLAPGPYQFQGYASALGTSSGQVNIQFVATAAPVPYTAGFVGGGLFHFHSDVLNKTRVYNPNDSFTIDIYYQYIGGTAELFAAYTNVTNFTMSFPDDGQIVVINIVDKYGWINGMNIDPSLAIFRGTPYSYDFGLASRQPFFSVEVQNFIPDSIGVFILTLVVILVVYRIRRGRR